MLTGKDYQLEEANRKDYYGHNYDSDINKTHDNIRKENNLKASSKETVFERKFSSKLKNL